MIAHSNILLWSYDSKVLLFIEFRCLLTAQAQYSLEGRARQLISENTVNHRCDNTPKKQRHV